MVSTIKSINEYNQMLNSAGQKLVILDFYAPWCGPCKQIDPHVRKLINIYKDKAIVIKINVDKFQDIADFYKVESMPTFIFIKNKKRVSRLAGADFNMLTKKMATYSN